jgi:hypothetical protein
MPIIQENMLKSVYTEGEFKVEGNVLVKLIDKSYAGHITIPDR